MHMSTTFNEQHILDGKGVTIRIGEHLFWITLNFKKDKNL